MMAVAMHVFGADAPAVTSVIITVSGAINGVFQMVIGLTNQYAGKSWGYRSSLLYAGVVLVMLFLLSQKNKSAKSAVCSRLDGVKLTPLKTQGVRVETLKRRYYSEHAFAYRENIASIMVG